MKVRLSTTAAVLPLNQYQIQECFDARVIFDLYDLGRS